MSEAKVDLASICVYKSTSKASLCCLSERWMTDTPVNLPITSLSPSVLPQPFFSAHLRDAFQRHGLITVSKHPMPKLFDKKSRITKLLCIVSHKIHRSANSAAAVEEIGEGPIRTKKGKRTMAAYLFSVRWGGGHLAMDIDSDKESSSEARMTRARMLPTAG
jgi:hypothetical protein